MAGAAATTLVQSTAGTPFAGAVVRNTAVMFPVDINAPFTGVSYSVPAGTTRHLVTGLVPNAAYDVSLQTSGGTIAVRVATGGGTLRADSGGVLTVSGASTTSLSAGSVAAALRTPLVAGRARAESAPARVLASRSGSGVVLTWTAPPGAAPVRYVISGGTARGASTLPVIVTADASTQYTIPALAPGTYYFRVAAVLAGGLTPASDDAGVVADGAATAPHPPTAAIASANGRRVTIAWTASDGDPATYHVEVGTAPGRADITTLTTTQTGVTYSAGPATYYMRVRAARGSAVSEPSNEVSVPVGPRACTAAPADPMLLPVSTSHGETTISWLARGDVAADRYRVDGIAPSGALTLVSRGRGTSLTTRLGPGIYAIRLSAVNGCGESARSNPIALVQPDPATKTDQ